MCVLWRRVSALCDVQIQTIGRVAVLRQLPSRTLERVGEEGGGLLVQLIDSAADDRDLDARALEDLPRNDIGISMGGSLFRSRREIRCFFIMARGG